MEKLYVFVYKCRYCGKLFNDGCTGKAIGIACLIQSACDLPKDKQHPGDKTIHITHDHAGIADLVGCRIED